MTTAKFQSAWEFAQKKDRRCCEHRAAKRERIDSMFILEGQMEIVNPCSSIWTQQGQRKRRWSRFLPMVSTFVVLAALFFLVFYQIFKK